GSTTIQMLMALAPVYREVGIERINISTYQAVSGSGRKGVEEIAGQTARLLNGLPVETDVFAKQITFNVLPLIGELQDNGYSQEEIKLVLETQKILGDDFVRVNPTCVQVPVFFGDAASLHVETRDSMSALDVRGLLESTPGIEVVDEPGDAGYAAPASEAVGNDAVFVSRIREDISSPNGINLWVVSDNIRKGAALNSVQIAELLVQQYL
ncbi:MAG: aspartate-semialdehyde dehydrogenase, partial [Pontibacterium sp.]